MTPDQIRRSWDDDDTPRSVFPEPLAERLTRENKELRAEIERLTASWFHERDRRADAETRLDVLVADLHGLADEWDRLDRYDDLILPVVGARKALRAVLDKHAGEQP